MHKSLGITAAELKKKKKKKTASIKPYKHFKTGKIMTKLIYVKRRTTSHFNYTYLNLIGRIPCNAEPKSKDKRIRISDQ